MAKKIGEILTKDNHATFSDLSIEQFLELEQARLAVEADRVKANIAKLQKRLADYKASEKPSPVEVARLEGLVNLHKSHEESLVASDVESLANQKFQNQANIKVDRDKKVAQINKDMANKAGKKLK